MGDKVSDKQISIWAESIARLMQRRKFLAQGLKGVGAAAAAIAIGSFAGVRHAFAQTCTCDWAFSGQCTGSGPYEDDCPSGCTICTSSDNCSGWCNWSSGAWVSCNGFGSCGNGYRMCIDCKCPNCSDVCTVLTGIICGNCCTKQQLEESLRATLTRLNAHAVDGSVYA